MNFNDFALRSEILQAVEEAGYSTPTPIQERSIPVVLTGRDLLGIAQTGTGKTAAFVLPMIERLASGQSKARMPRSLILSPTRELATQTANYFDTYGKHLNLSMALLIGGVGMDEQWRKLDRGVDVLIATPGRLIDQFERGKVLLGGVSILVIDEADRMLDMGFIPDVERIVGLISRRRQTLMFSATMPKEIRRLADTFLTSPEEVQAAPPATTAAGVDDHLMLVAPRQKFKTLRRLIESQDIDKAIIFCNRKREVSSLRRQMERAGLNVCDIHGDLDQAQRTKALDAFKNGDFDFLVATDVAARGLDIARLPCVINYDVPIHADDYVHRIGRTGRAGLRGRAFTMAMADEQRFVDAIAKLRGKEMPLLEPADGAAAADADMAARPTEEPSAAPTRKRRTRTRKAAAPAAIDGEAQQPQAADEQPAATVPADDEAKPNRRTRSRRAERREPEAAEPAQRVEQPVAEAEAKPSSRRKRGSSRRSKSRDEAAAAQPAPTPRSAPQRGRGGRAPEGPIIGMGEHVPLFMRRPMPNLRSLDKANED